MGFTICLYSYPLSCSHFAEDLKTDKLIEAFALSQKLGELYLLFCGVAVLHHFHHSTPLNLLYL